jgi:hypothetical protein
MFRTAARERWIAPVNYSIVRQRISDISKGKRPDSDLVILDDEFSIASKQLWEFSLIERVSGKVLINTTIAHEHGLNHAVLGSRCVKMVSEMHAKAVFSSKRKKIDRMTVHQVAAKLKEAGIGPETIVLVWAVNNVDLKILRQFLESAGYYDILPLDKNCIPLIHVLRPNLPKITQKAFPLRLEILFPTMFPVHPLVGLNHEALVDCQQTRLVCMGFNELCRLVEERGTEWQPETVARSSQTTILDFLKKRDRDGKGRGYILLSVELALLTK